MNLRISLLVLGTLVTGIWLEMPCKGQLITDDPSLPPVIGQYLSTENSFAEFRDEDFHIIISRLQFAYFRNIERHDDGHGNEIVDFDATLRCVIEILDSPSGPFPPTELELTGPVQKVYTESGTSGSWQTEIISMCLSGDVGGLNISLTEDENRRSVGTTIVTEIDEGLWQLDGTTEHFFTVEISEGRIAHLNGPLRLELSSEPLPLAYVDPFQFDVIRGIHVGGDLSDVVKSDDSYLRIQPGITLSPAEPPVWLEFDGKLQTDNPTSLMLAIEAHANTPGLVQRVEFYNYDDGSYEEVDIRSATTSDSTIEIFVTGDVTRFVEQGTTNVIARVGWRAQGPILLYPWTISIDQVFWTITSS